MSWNKILSAGNCINLDLKLIQFLSFHARMKYCVDDRSVNRNISQHFWSLLSAELWFVASSGDRRDNGDPWPVLWSRCPWHDWYHNNSYSNYENPRFLYFMISSHNMKLLQCWWQNILKLLEWQDSTENVWMSEMPLSWFIPGITVILQQTDCFHSDTHADAFKARFWTMQFIPDI